METSKEALKVIFNTFDKDGSGYIDKQEIYSISKELGQELSEDEVKKIFKVIDTDGDGKISFDEFHQWWFYGKQNKLEKFVYLKFKNTKYLKKLQKKTQKKLGPLLEQKYESGKNEHFLQVNVGTFEKCKLHFSVDVRGGLENKTLIQSLQKHFPSLDENVFQIVFRIRCENSENVKVKFQEFITNGLDLAMTMIPEEQQPLALMMKDTLVFDYATTEEQLFIRLSTQNEIIEQTIAQYQAFAQMFISEAFSLLLKVKIETSVGIDDFVAAEQDYLLNTLSRGLRVQLDAIVNSELGETARAFYYQFLSSMVEKNLFNKYVRMMKDLVLLPLLLSSKIILNFSGYENFCQEFDLENSKIPKPAELLEMAKGANIGELIANIPFIADLVEVLRSYCQADSSTMIITKDVSVSIHGQFENVSQLWDKLVGQ